MKKYFKKYSVLLVFVILSFLIECTGALITDGSFMIYDVRYFLTINIIIISILFLIKSDIARFFTAFGVLLFLGLFNMVFLVMYELTGQYFTYAMFNLRNDAVGIMESIPLDFFFVVSFVTLMTSLFVFGRRYTIKLRDEKIEQPIKGLRKVMILISLICTALVFNFFTAKSINGNQIDRYENMLYSNTSGNYKQYGITSNFVNELYSGLIFNENYSLPNEDITNFLYGIDSDQSNISQTSDYFGVSQGNNVITILAETFEWFCFIKDSINYPNGFDEDITEDDLRELFPYLYKLYDNSIVLDNYHVREKTDVSEMYLMAGSYPSNTYINYDYPDNKYSMTVANVLQDLNLIDLKYSNYFHNGTYTFYNRNNTYDNLGFEHYYSSEELEVNHPDLFTNYINDGDRNLDSELFNSTKDYMIYEDNRFYSYALTITMHGVFSKRDNIEEQGHYDTLRKYGLDIDEKNLFEKDPDKYNFISYVATALEVEKSIKILFEDLEKKGVLENTTILLFGDHQAYYQGLSQYVKDINNEKQAVNEGRDYNDLYRIPVMIYDEKLVQAVTNNGLNDSNRIITKFTNPSDLVPTLFDILGINTFDNLYFGESIFTDVTSMAYSRSYGYFFNDDILFRNLNNIMFVNEKYRNTKGEVNANYLTNVVVPSATILVERMRYIDQIYQQDYFNDEDNYSYYLLKMKEINPHLFN